LPPRLRLAVLVLCASPWLAPAGRAENLLEKLKAAERRARPSGGPDAASAGAGLKEALTVGAGKAVKAASLNDGYFKDPEIRIPLPEDLRKNVKLLRRIGLGRDLDAFELSMNRAAEKAAPQAERIFVDAVKEMTISDALGILRGADTAATSYLKSKTSEKIFASFKPLVAVAMDSVGVTKSYKKVADRARRVRLLRGKAPDLDVYVTGKAMDGLFVMVGRQEREIRRNPAARVTDLLKKVFK